MRAALVIVLIVLAPGCLGAEPAGGSDATPCRTGAGPLFLNVSRGGGFVANAFIPTYWSVDREGDLFRFSGEWARPGSDGASEPSGTGRVDATNGKLHNITTAQVREELQRAGVWRADRDWNVTVSYRIWLGNADFGTWCQRALADLPGVGASPSRTNCADDPWFTLSASTSRATLSTTASAIRDCDNAPARLHDFYEDFLDLAAAKERPYVSSPA